MSTLANGSLTLSSTNLGKRLTHDIVDRHGEVLFSAGTIIDQKMIDVISGRPIVPRGGKVSPTVPSVVKGSLPEPKKLLDPKSHTAEAQRFKQELLAAFPGEVYQSIQESINELQETLTSSIESIATKTNFKASPISNSVFQIVQESSRDVTAALAVLSQRAESKNSVLTQRIINHATHLSSLGVAISLMLGHDKKTCSDIGLAGLLHDCAILMHIDLLNPTRPKSDHVTRQRFRQHPLLSAKLLSGLPGLSSEALQLITQVHEQMDGSGYPTGLTGPAILPGAQILNLADAYLSLVLPLSGQPIVPGDAIAYLCYHTSRGKFSHTVFQAFLDHASMYPIGSIVELDDSSTAVVVRGNRQKPMAPIVRFDDKEIDLNQSQRYIRSVRSLGLEQGVRISKKRLSEVLWRLDV